MCDASYLENITVSICSRCMNVSLWIYYEQLSKDQKQRRRCSIKNGVLKNFATFTEKHL